MRNAPHREVVVFNAALKLPVGRREPYLQSVCHGDVELYQRVSTLLRAHDKAGGFLQKPAAESSGLLPESRTPSSDTTVDASAPGAEKCGDRVGPYKLLQQIGEGGCGVVYLAEQEEPVRRRVALKIIKLGMDTKRVIARFEAERQALAMMDHPNIAKVLDGGATATGRPFFVMELVRGIKITDFCDRNAFSTRQRLELFIKVCRAIQHAHQKSVIHRDIKPSNILVTVNDGVAVPKVIDFGIAKATEGRLTDQTLFTPFDQFVGTPAYMSPEQAVLTSVDVDTRSDLYSLGVLLYELVTGQTPFDQKELMVAGLESMRQTLRQTEPARPSTRLQAMGGEALTTVARQRQSEPPRLIQLVRGDLDLITMKCLEKDRALRYESTGDLAADVERFLAHEPIVARPPSHLYRLRKLVRRNRLAVTAAAAVVAALFLGLGVSTWQFLQKSEAEREQSRLREQAQRAQAEEARSRRRAEAQELTARRLAYASDMNLLQQALAAEDLGHAQDLLNRQRPQPGQQDLRGWEWRYFWQFCQTDASLAFCQRSNSILSISFSSDGSLLAVGTYLQGEVTVWDVATRQMVFRHAQPRNGAPRLAFAPDGPLLAYYEVTNNQRNVVLWNSESRTEARRLPLAGALRELAFTRDGRLLTAEAGSSNNLTLWHAASGRALARFSARMATREMGKILDVTGDGTRFVHALQSPPQSVSVIDANGHHSPPLPVADEITTAVALAQNGRTLLTGAGYAEGAIKLWDVPSQKLVGLLEAHRSWVSCLKLLPDGRTLASASADRTVRLWDVASRRLLRTLRGQRGEVWTIDISPNGRWLASGGKDGSVVLWDLAGPDTHPPAYRTLPLTGVEAWSPTPDSRLLSVLYHRHIRLYDAGTLRLERELPSPLTNVTSMAFSPDLRLLAVTDPQGKLGLWDMQEERFITNVVAHPIGATLNSVFLDDGRSVVTWAGDTCKEWDVATWTERRHWPVKSDLNSWVAQPGANAMAAGWVGGDLEYIPLPHPEQRRRFAGQSRVISVALSADGKTLAAASENGTLELWNPETATRRAILRGVLLGYHSVAISPDGTRVIAGSNGQEAMAIWDLPSQTEVAMLPGRGSFFINAAFTPDGNTIGAANWNGEVHVWTAPSWKQIATAEAGPVPPADNWGPAR